MINFSSNLGEGNIFWNDQKEINQYVSRTQYALRSGKPHADVLIYFPFMNVEGMPANPEEIFTKGDLEDHSSDKNISSEKLDEEKVKWASKAYPLINALEAKGISWIFVNDISLQEAMLEKDLQINIRGNRFKTLILVNTPIIQMKTAEQINILVKKGMQLLAVGELPKKQPSFLNWKENDIKTAKSISSALKSNRSIYIENESQLDKWSQHFTQNIMFDKDYHFTRQVQREMSDGSRLQFIWNKSNQWQTLDLTLSQKYKSSFWMNAESGIIQKNQGSNITYRIAPYSSIILYASTAANTEQNQFSTPLTDFGKEMITIKNWDIRADTLEIKGAPLFDWKTNDKLKFSSEKGIYKSSFTLETIVPNQQYILDLGRVCYTAEVYINGNFIGKRIYSPYLFDITSSLKSGTNLIEIKVATAQLNGFIGKAKNGDKKYNQFKDKEGQIVSAGLIGPVVIKSEK